MITYNARGYPPSDVPRDLESYSQDIAIEDLRQLLIHLDIEQAHVAGLSMGGNVALNFGIAHPEMSKSLVVAGTGSGSTDPERFRKGDRHRGRSIGSRRDEGSRILRPVADPACSCCVRGRTIGAPSPNSSRITRPSVQP